jgi:hypothetical protein
MQSHRLTAPIQHIEDDDAGGPAQGKTLDFGEPTLIAEIEFRGWMHEGARVMRPTRDWAR